MATECNFPDCDRPAKTRGLCIKHYRQAKMAATPAIRQTAARYLDPPKPGSPGTAGGKTARAKTKTAPAKTPSAFNDPDAPPRPEAPLTIGALSDDARAAVHESYIALGAKSVRFGEDGGDGILYIFPEHRRSIWIGPAGRIEHAEIHKGTDREKIA